MTHHYKDGNYKAAVQKHLAKPTGRTEYPESRVKEIRIIL